MRRALWWTVTSLPQWNHCVGMKNYVEKKHCVEMNTQTNWLIDWYKFECWPENSEKGWIWLKITRLFKKPTIEHELQKPFQFSKFQYCKLVKDSSWFNIHWTASTVLENWMKRLGKLGFIHTYFFLTKIETAQSWPTRVSDY